MSVRTFLFEAVLALVLATPFVFAGLVQRAVSTPRPPVLEPTPPMEQAARKLAEADGARAHDDFVGCVRAAQDAVALVRTASVFLNGHWLQAQCALLARDFEGARAALDAFYDNANITDPRFAVAKAQRAALARGEQPAGVRD
jgi:hypothetical protein